MSDVAFLSAAMAQRLIDDLGVVQDLLAKARDQLEPTTPQTDRSHYLLQLTELKTLVIVDTVRSHAAGPGRVRPRLRVVRNDEPRGPAIAQAHDK